MHIPVLQKEVLKYLDPKPNENFIDCTIGQAGHTLAIFKKNGPKGKVLGIDQDPKQIENCKLKIENFKERVILVCDNFVNLKKIVEREKFRQVFGILFDLGMSSWHLEKSGRGFSFQKDEPLIMRYDWKKNSKTPLLHSRRISEKNLTAEKIINQWPEKKIEKILREYGQERFAKRIAKKIIEERKIKEIKTTFQLVKIIKSATPIWYQRKKIHPATRTFQALRIAVNDELNNLEKALPQALEILEKGGRMVVISFHSLEDKIVKNFFKKKVKEKSIKILTPKPIRPSVEEIKINPRSRSAKLRAIKKI